MKRRENKYIFEVSMYTLEHCYIRLCVVIRILVLS